MPPPSQVFLVVRVSFFLAIGRRKKTKNKDVLQDYKFMLFWAHDVFFSGLNTKLLMTNK